MWFLLILMIMNIFKNVREQESKKLQKSKIKEDYITDNRLTDYDEATGIYPNILFTDTNNCDSITFETLKPSEKKKLFKLPKNDKLQIHKYNNVLDDRINSVDKYYKIKNESKLIYELNTDIFNTELIKLINKDKVEYVNKYVDYDKLDENYMTYLLKPDVSGTKPIKDDTNIKDTFYKIKYNQVNDIQLNNFNNITDYILKKVNNNSAFNISGNVGGIEKFKIVQNKINFILQNKNNKNELLYDFDIVIYRQGKGHGIHISFEVLYTGTTHITDIEAVGIVTDDKIYLITSSNEYLNDLVYYKYKEKYVIINNPIEGVISRMSPMQKVDLMRERARKLLLDRGMHTHNT